MSQLELIPSELNLIGVHPEIINLVEKHKEFQISYQEFVEQFSNKHHIHNHTLENLFLYFSLEKNLQKNRVAFYKGGLLIIDNRKHKFFIYDDELFLSRIDFSGIEETKKKIIIYSSVKQELIDPKTIIESKLKELSYNLEEIFDPSNAAFIKKYKDKDPNTPMSKIKKRIDEYTKKPIRKIEEYKKEGFQYRDFKESDLEEMEKVHKEWVDYKMNDPAVFKMLFSPGRYNKCIKMVYTSEYLSRKDFYMKTVWYQNEMVACIQCIVKDKIAYGVGYFSKFWKLPHNFVSNIFSMYLKDLYEQGIVTMRYGMPADANLLTWKRHLPHEMIITMKYNLK